MADILNYIVITDAWAAAMQGRRDGVLPFHWFLGNDGRKYCRQSLIEQYQSDFDSSGIANTVLQLSPATDFPQPITAQLI